VKEAGRWFLNSKRKITGGTVSDPEKQGFQEEGDLLLGKDG